MNDRELVEAAALAAGLDVAFMALSGPTIMSGPRAGDSWSPLTHDGDALRLAVQLRISLDLWDRQVGTANGRALFGGNCIVFIGDSDPYAATRRAIVRAAADIGTNRAPATALPG